MRKLRFGIIGAGIMGRMHAAVLKDHHGSEVVAVSSRKGEAASQLASYAGAANVYTDYRALLDDPQVDAISLCTPDHVHTEIALEAARRGKHLLIEKPLATSLAEALQIERAVREAGVRAMCLFSNRWLPPIWQVKQKIDAGLLGQLVLGHARKHDRIWVAEAMINWAAQTTPAWFLSSHDIDLLVWMFGRKVQRVFATEVRGVLTGKGIDTPDAMTITLEFAGGGVGAVEASWIYPNTFPAVVDAYMHVIGTSGTAQVDRQQEGVRLVHGGAYEYPKNQLSLEIDGHLQGGFRYAVTHFVDAVHGGQEPMVTLESSVHVTAVLEAAHRSAKTGAPVEVQA